MHTAPYKSPDEQGLQAGPVTSKGKVRANYSKEELNSAGPTQERTHTMGLRVAVGSWRAPRWAPSQVDRPPARGSLGTGGLRLLGEALTVNIKMCTGHPRIYFSWPPMRPLRQQRSTNVHTRPRIPMPENVLEKQITDFLSYRGLSAVPGSQMRGLADRNED